MTIQNPSLTLTFYSSPNSTPVSTTSIVRDSIQINEQLYNDLKASSNTVSLQLKPDDTSFIEDIIKDNADIKAELKDGTTPVFTGLLANDYTWRISQTGEDVFQIKIEDMGTRYLDRPYASEDDTCIRDTISGIFNAIAVRCGNAFQVSFDSSVPTSLQNKILVNKISSSKTCKDILDTICYEFGMVYYFNSTGNLVVKKTNITASPSTTVASTGNYPHYLYVENRSSLDLTRKARQYSQAKVKYDILSDSTTNVPVYYVTENIQVPAGQWWDGETHSESIYELTMDEFFLSGKTYYIYNSSTQTYDAATVTVGTVVTPNTYYEYSSASSTVEMTDIDNGKDIIYVYPNSVVPNETGRTTGLPGFVEASYFASSQWTLKPHNNTTKLDVLIDNTNGAVSAIYTLFSAKARIIRKQSTSNIYRSVVGLTSNTEVQFNYESEWIHEKDDAVNLCELLSNYYLYCNNTYTFWCKDDLTLGSIVRVYENLFTDLDINLFLIARQYNAYGERAGLYKYTAQAVSAFDLETTGRADTTTSPPENQGPQGPEGPSIVTTLQYALTSSSSVQPGANDWYDTRPTGWYHGMCYWQREKSVSSSGGTTYSTAVVDTSYNNLMEGLVVFKLESNPSTYRRNLRESNNQLITINVQLDYYPNHCSISAKNERDENIQVTQVIQDKEYTITVNDVNDFDKIIVTGTLSGANPQVLTLNVVDDTEYNKNFGSLNAALPDEEILNGDYFFCSGQFTDDNYTFQMGFPYVKENDSWTQLTGTTPENAQRLIGVMGTVLSNNEDPDTNSATYSWFANLAAQSAVIQSLFSEAITILNPGYIKSANFAEVDGFVSQGFKLSSSGLGQFGEGTQLGNVDIRIDDSVAGTPVQLLTTSKYAAGATYNVPSKTRWKTNDFKSAWGTSYKRYVDNPNGTYNGNSYYLCASGDMNFKPGETNDYVLKFDRACTVTIKFNSVDGIGRYLANLIIDGNNYSYYIGHTPAGTDSRETVTYTKSVAAGGTITVNTRNFPYDPNNTAYETDGVRLMGSCQITVDESNRSGAILICDRRLYGYSNSSQQTLPVAGTYNFTYLPPNTYVQNSMTYITNSTTISSSSYINYTNLSNFASMADGNYTCINSNISGQTIQALTKSGNTIYFYTSGGGTLEYLLTPDTSTAATTGWYDVTGTINLVGSQSSLITYNINASNSSADIGAIQPYRNINGTYLNGTVRGNVNGDSSSSYGLGYKVWGAVFN